MYPRKPLSRRDQIERMKRCARNLRTQLRHRYDEFFEATKGRRDCPFEVQVRDRLLEATRDAVALAEACLEELRRQEVMFYAPFKPGDRVVVDYARDDATMKQHRYLIYDVRPGKRSEFHYEAMELTKKGTVHARRAPHWIFPRPSITIRESDATVSAEAESESRYFRDCAKNSRVCAFERGDLTMFEAIEGGLGRRTYRRKDRVAQ